MACIITGCTLIAYNEYVGGDLHKIGDYYVFSAIKDKEGNSRWSADHLEYAHYSKTVHISGEFFDKSGIIIVPIAHCVLNTEAQEYLK